MMVFTIKLPSSIHLCFPHPPRTKAIVVCRRAQRTRCQGRWWMIPPFSGWLNSNQGGKKGGWRMWRPKVWKQIQIIQWPNPLPTNLGCSVRLCSTMMGIMMNPFPPKKITPSRNHASVLDIFIFGAQPWRVFTCIYHDWGMNLQLKLLNWAEPARR